MPDTIFAGPYIYVASLADYNAGRKIHGAWIDATLDPDEIETEVKAMLRSSKYPNVTVACPDCDGTGAASPISPCETCKGSGEVPSAEEWAIHDYGQFAGIRINEYDSFVLVSALANMVEEHGEAFAAWYDNGTASDDPDEWEDEFSAAYRGTFRSVEDYAADFAENTGMLHGVDESISMYFDFEAYARDLETGGDIWTAPGGDGVFVFDNH